MTRPNGVHLFIAWLGAALAVLATVTYCANPRSELRVGYVTFTGSLPLLVADQLGFFEEAGISVQLRRYNSPGQMMQDVGQEIDLAGPTSIVEAVNAEQASPGSYYFLCARLPTGPEGRARRQYVLEHVA